MLDTVDPKQPAYDRATDCIAHSPTFDDCADSHPRACQQRTGGHGCLLGND